MLKVGMKVIVYFHMCPGLYFIPTTVHSGILNIICSPCYPVFIMFFAMGWNEQKIQWQL